MIVLYICNCLQLTIGKKSSFPNQTKIVVRRHLLDHTVFTILGAGTHAMLKGYLEPWELSVGENMEINSGRGYYRSKEKIPGVSPFGGSLTNKKYHLNEVKIE